MLLALKIHPGSSSERTIVGFNRGMAGTGTDEDVIDFLDQRDYEPQGIPAGPEDDNSSFRFVETSRSIDKRDVHELGHFCLTLIDPTIDIALVMDYRETLPSGSAGRIIAQA